MDSDEVVREWMAERRRHPMFNEPNGSSFDSFWEKGASTYSASSYDRVLNDMVSCMVDEGYVDPGRSLIDIGSGPGTFAAPLSRHCASVLCADISPGMLARIDAMGLPNVTTLLSDCMSLPEIVRDVSFSSLCPPMNCPEGLEVMERTASELCVYVSSADPCPGLEIEIWKALGKDYSYRGYDTRYPARYLESRGRSPELRFFSQTNETAEPESVVADRFVRKVSAYRTLAEGEEGIIRGAVADRSEDGTVRITAEVRLGMLVWEPR